MPVLSYSRIISLSHTVSPNMPHWPGDPQTLFTPIADISRDGYFLRSLTMGEHSGTHANAPASFFSDGATMEDAPPEQHILPAVVMDISAHCAQNSDACLLPEDIRTWESRNGRIPEGSLILLHTGWAGKWDSPDAFLGLTADNTPHFPGFGADAARMLVHERGAAGLGIDTHGLDRGVDTEFTANREILKAGGWALECLCNLDRLPPTGTTVIIAPLKLEGGSGSPATVLALVP